MGYDFTVRGPWYSVKKEGEYPWGKELTARLYPDDIFQKADDGTFTRVNSLGICNIQLTDDQIIEHNEPRQMRMM